MIQSNVALISSKIIQRRSRKHIDSLGDILICAKICILYRTFSRSHGMPTGKGQAGV